MTRRSKDEILTQILEACDREGMIKTRIIYVCNINFKEVNLYLERMVHAGLMEVKENTYRTTKKGVEALGYFRAFRALVGPEIFK